MKITLLLTILGASLLCISSCNTIAGVGEDISSGGQAINDAATHTQQKM